MLQGVCQLINNPEQILPDGVADFLWAHLHCDLGTLGKATNKSPDDCVILLHHVIDAMAKPIKRLGEDTTHFLCVHLSNFIERFLHERVKIMVILHERVKIMVILH